ncbi:TPA: hypothetical protein N0F65_012222 [Lagenidium giganteum]|uniref:Uncharacterized protein n=1 Tax=Lagenidium giganteum TaxID=4803 RepID=A0AAV2ZIP1_9STRA|nr:TPA: hypothetical protein N0F65_012222 [Lagenidium giganteum]
MTSVPTQKSIAPSSTSQHLQGLWTRKSTTAEPKNAAQYFNHVAEVVRINEDLTALRRYNLKRRYQVHYQGYEAVLNRKKRADIKNTPTTSTFLSTRPSVTGAQTPPYISPFQSIARAKSPVKHNSMPSAAAIAAAAAAAAVAASAANSASAPATTSTAVSTTASKPSPSPASAPAAAPVRVAPAAATPKRADFTLGTSILIRHTPDLVACGARNLVGKTGRIVTVPQLYGQELYSVYIDEHETIFQVPFNALVLVPSTTSAVAAAAAAASAAANTAKNAITQQQPALAPVQSRPGPTLEEIKMEHSFQLHRLMQQQYREIQVLQQQYAECRLVNPAALPAIQKELSKLRLVHLSQVQTLKSKQALDLLGK